MLSRVQLGLLLCVASGLGFLVAGAARNPQLCEGYAGPDGRYHRGFQCPRLGDPPGHRYCCRPGPGPSALKSCCGRAAWEALPGGNRSAVPPPVLLRNPLALPVVGLYGLLVLLLMAIDLLHFHRRQRCRLGRLLRCSRPTLRPPHSRSHLARGAQPLGPRGAPTLVPLGPRTEG